MEHWLESMVPWGSEAIVWLQAHSTAWLDQIAALFTMLGYEEFYLFALPLVYWCVHKQAGIGLAYVSLMSAWLNDALKYLWGIPRPSDARILMKAPRLETSPSFPSGHAQNAVANWGYLALVVRRRWFTLAAVAIIVGVGLSRPVLGVHFPQDVIAGWLIGIGVLAVFWWAAPHIGRRLAARQAAIQVLLAVAVPLALVFVHPAGASGLYPAEGAVTPAAALAGLGVGLVMERAWVRFRVDGPWWKRILRLLLGFLVLAVFYVGPSRLAPEGLPHLADQGVRFVRYALLGWTVAFLAPWLFVRLRLADASPAE